MCIISEDGKMDGELEALQKRRKEEIEKLEKDLPLMEAQRAAFETEDLNKEKATVLRDRIDGAKNALVPPSGSRDSALREGTKVV
jgi:hypothetical protein